MRGKIKSALLRVVPQKVIETLFGSKVSEPKFQRRFISIPDEIAGKPFQMYLREDGWIELEFLKKGLYGEWEKESLKIWAQLSKTSQTIIDIGSNTGTYSLIAQNNNPLAKVVAIEPVDINFEVLTKNIKQNKFPVYTQKVALSEKEGTAKMFMLKDRLNYMTSVNDDRYALHPEIKWDIEVVEIEVPIKPYSYVHEKLNLSGIDLIKIDVEGHEVAVLDSMMPYLKKYKPTILIEIIGDENALTLDKLFRNAGYVKYISIDEENKSVVVDKLWDNDHHNFLICNNAIVQQLRAVNLVQ